MDAEIKMIAFDLDGTLTQHKSPITAENRAVLDRLSERYKLLVVSAGGCRRVFEQMGRYPIDIIGNYGLQTARYDAARRDITITEEIRLPCDPASIAERIRLLREKFGFTEFAGESMKLHDSGFVTFPILGTAAKLPDKLGFDPDRTKRRALYREVKAAFPEYTVFIGGSESFDMIPAPYSKYYALDRYCRETGYRHGEVAYVGDDYGAGGNDEAVYLSDFRYIKIDRYTDLPAIMRDF